MKRGRFTEEQINGVLREHEAENLHARCSVRVPYRGSFGEIFRPDCYKLLVAKLNRSESGYGTSRSVRCAPGDAARARPRGHRMMELFAAVHESAFGTTRTCRDVCDPVAIGW